MKLQFEMVETTFRFVCGLDERGQRSQTARVLVDLYGSLALTGRGHATDKAILLGLSGEKPDTVDAGNVEAIVELVRSTGRLRLGGQSPIPFREPTDLVFHDSESLPGHPNGMRFTAFDSKDAVLSQEVYYSVGGGFVVRENESAGSGSAATPVPHEFASAAELLAIGQRTGLAIADIVAANEASRRPIAETDAGLDRIWAVMEQCIERGCRTDGVLPGGLGVQRRAARLARDLHGRPGDDPMACLDWVSLFALAVNEENAAGGQVVTAPTNGAAGVIPAVLAYHQRFARGADAGSARRFLMTAAAIGMLYKRNASLSAAEMGCQGEVGVACSMAAAGLAAVMGGTNEQIENAAEIGMEHNLGLTCDPIGGLVQIPCIERNTMGALKAINAARLAVLHGDGEVIACRWTASSKRLRSWTGVDMQSKYKEIVALGGPRGECGGVLTDSPH